MSVEPDLSQAIQRRERWLALEPDNAFLRVDLGDLYHQAGRFGDAMRCLDQVLNDEPDHAVALGRKASVLLSQHRFEEAEAVLRPLIDHATPDPALLHNLGLSLAMQQRWDEARHCFADASGRGLVHAANFRRWIEALRHLGRMNEAIEVAHQWVQSAKTEVDAQGSRGCLARLHFDDGDAQTAGRIADSVLSAAPNDGEAHAIAGFAAVERQEVERARAHFNASLQRRPDDALAWQGIGLLHLYAQEHEQAREAFERVQRLDPGNLGNRVALGWVMLMTKDVAGAEKVFNEALLVNRTFGESHGGLASVRALQGNAAEAEHEIKVARKLDPAGFSADFAQAVLWGMAGRQQEAAQLVKNLLERAPGRHGLLPLVQQLRHYIGTRSTQSLH
ncbi:tetratricopeptide repeat protein [Aquabacterium humicola]|uniref:tetratricopeptide repeat protein n=1 Tax=Aquabacterium humicola TaxID=3237377 RepID=UPI002542C054|nr:tetratricopeptide repeat protein [Rubrivivax pictus]